MDAKQIELVAELKVLLRRTSEVACQLQKREQGRGTPHYDQIESAAHDVGLQLSRMVQQLRTGELAAEQTREATCPQCRNKCPVTTTNRQVTSVDGPVELIKSVAFCTCCRRFFFPQRKGLGLDARESARGFKRQLVILNAEVRSLKRVRIVVDRVPGQKISTNTVERIYLDVAKDLAAAEQREWNGVINGEVPEP